MLRQLLDCPIESGNDRHDICKMMIDTLDMKEGATHYRVVTYNPPAWAVLFLLL